MSAAKSRRLRLVAGAVAAFAVSALAAPAWGQSPPPIRLTELGFERDLPRNPQADLREQFQSARTNIRDARRAADAAPGVPLDPAYVARVEQAAAECSAGLRQGNRLVVDAHSCVAEASLLLAQGAQQDRDSRMREAIRNFATVAHLVHNRDRARAAVANRYLGDALRARYDLSGNTTYLAHAIRAFDLSIDRQPTHGALAALARAYGARGDTIPADAAYDRLLALRPETGPDFLPQDRAAAFATRARLPNRTAAEAETYWRSSLAAFRTGEAAVELGKLLWRTNRTEAESLFQEAIRLPSVPGPSATNYQLEAYYSLSLLQSPASAEPTRSQWELAFQNAKLAGNSQPHYRRQACLSHIGRGGDDYHIRRRNLGTAEGRRLDEQDRARVEAASIHCLGVDTGPEGQLLRGMYWLRRAQWYFVGEDQSWQSNMNQAADAFRLGGMQAGAAGARPLDWPGDPVGGVTLAEALRFGSEVVNSAFSRCNRPVSNSSPAYALFAKYDVAQCRPRLN